MKNKVILVIRDGWGYNKSHKNNAIYQNAPYTEQLMKKYPNTLLKASGEAVGLPKGYQGNSEVGHLTIGSGRILFQPLPRINQAIKDKTFFKNKAFLKAINNCKKHNTTLHLMGLLQSQGVHSHEDHLHALLDLCKKENLKNVNIHIFTDGRDAPTTEAIKHLKKLQRKIKKLRLGKITTIQGRFYAMDRDKRWDRTKTAYNAIVKGEAKEFTNIITEIKQCYKNNETDEFIKPRKISNYQGIQNKDSIIFFNFRTDRTRQLTKAIVEKKFEGWDRKPLKVCYTAMTKFYEPMNAEIAFEDQKNNNLLGEIISKNNLNQLRISETEKYAHVTFFFNGQIEKPNKNEDRILVHSPKVKTYDLKPEMSAEEITDKLIEKIKKEKYDFAVINLVNGDLVGHTGKIKACKKAVETVDKQTKKIVEAGLAHNYTMLIFADHGNIEDQRKAWSTSHTINKVPLIVISQNKLKLKKGGLADIAPTVLKLLKIHLPKEMTGKSLIK
jgi:2,3-bisphosphoglycerate-independent phosphoglycerate mutase